LELSLGVSSNPRDEAPDARAQRQAKTREELERLRLRLLDLSGRNRFLNFKHSETSGNQLRLINASLDALQGGIESALELSVRGIRKPHDLQPTLVLSEEETGEDESASEKRSRSRRFDFTATSEAAKQQGIAPDFDLPLNNARPRVKEIQFLLFTDDLERRLQGIYDKERRSVQELGISTLFLCLGFLEWYEADHSDKKYLAPLALYPIEITRALSGTKYRFTVRGVGEDPETNVSLIERLSRDFAIRLPELSQEQSISSYLTEISVAVSEQKRWRVRSMATIAILNFAKLAMYKDLDPEERPPDSTLESNTVIVDVLSGTESTGSLAIDPEEPDVQSITNVPLLVTEADSSQFGAIAEALTPRSLVIEGPPGTGKSQTITNIIAGAISKGMRVLFVAEKLAALEVVKSKIDHFGLGSYCLELHSTKARKLDAYQSIKERLYLKRPTKPNIEVILSDIDQQKRIVDDYIAALHAYHGNLGETVHTLLWREQRLRLELESDAAKVEQIHISGAEDYSPTRLAATAQALDGFEATSLGISASYGSPSHHPWFGFLDPAASLEQRRALVSRLVQAQHQIDLFLVACRHFATTVGIKAELTVGQWTDIAALSCALAAMDPGLPPHILQRLRDNNAVTVLQRFISNIDEAVSLEQGLGLPLVEALIQREPEYRRLEATCDTATLGASAESVSVSALSDLIESKLKRFIDLTNVQEFGVMLETYVRDLTSHTMELVANVQSLLHDTPRRILLLRTETLALEENQAATEELCHRGSELRQQQSAMTRSFDLAGLPTCDGLREDARVLRGSGLLWFFNANVREARKLYRRCSYDKGAKSNEQIAASFTSVADFLSDRQAFLDDPEAHRLFGKSFAGLETDVDAFQAAVIFAAKVRQLTSDQSRASVGIRRLLLTEDISLIDKFMALLHGSQYEALTTYLADSAWPRIGQELATLQQQRQLLEALREAAISDHVPATFSIADVFRAVSDARRHRDLCLKIEGDGAAKDVLREHFAGRNSNRESLRAALAYIAHLNAARRKLPPIVLDRIAAADLGLLRDALSSLMPLWLSDAGTIAAVMDALQKEVQLDTGLFFGSERLHDVPLEHLSGRVKRALDHAETLDDWVRYLYLRAQALQAAGQDLVSRFERNEIREDLSLSKVFTYLVVRSIVRSAIDRYPALRNFPGVTLESARERFRNLDRRVIETQRAVLAAQLHSRMIDPGNNAGPRGTWTGLALLNNEVNKQRRHITIRDLVQRAGTALQQIKPCFMMSPLSVAQYLPPGSIEFDLVVIDEASQMKPEDALGALSRAHYAVVVGDPKQLPPTSFFEREIEDEETSDEDSVDNESILLLAMSQYGKRRLRWHYRSKHQSLIAFSNHHFYENDLIVFPSPEPSGERGVRNHFVGGAYKSGTNPDEVRAVSEAAIRFMKDYPELSLGVVAINREQRELIYDEVTRLIAGDRDANKYVERWDSTLYPFFVKNLESVQGDERDVIFISTVYGAEHQGGAVAQRFGPILGPSGWRRLNVLFTRARERVEVFTSMTANDIRVDERSVRGVRALRDYLDYAANGRLETGTMTHRPPDSDFEIAVGRLLEAAGYEVEPQVGVGHYYIDLAVRHPRSGSFMLGIECDGATYHSAKSARDRDRTREEALRSLGWSLYRIWSTDWFADTRREFTKLQQHLGSLA
jgi:very-short-patch-repair endonuclease